MNVHTLNRNKHESFLADHRKDPYTKELLKTGDRIVICANCKTAYLESSWNAKGHCFAIPKNCESSSTLRAVPNERSINNLDGINLAQPRKRSSPLGWIASILLIVVLIAYYHTYVNDQERIKDLRNDLKSAQADNVTLGSANARLLSENAALAADAEELGGILSNVEIEVGFPSDMSQSDSFDDDWKLFFSVYKPITLNSLKVCSENNGKIKLQVYNLGNELVAETVDYYLYKGEKEWHRLTTDLSLAAGNYYMTFEGDTDLKYDGAGKPKYPYAVQGIVEITGSDSQSNRFNTAYYQYFYDWRISLQPI